MPHIQVPAAVAALSVTGGVDGTVNITSNTLFYPGCEAWLINAAGTTSQRCLIVALSGADSVRLRFIDEDNEGSRFPSPNYGYSDCSAFTVIGPAAARLSMPAQSAPVNDNNAKVLSV